MKKRMLVLSMLCAVTLGAVTTSVLSSCGTSEEQKVDFESVSITNKDTLQAKWKMGDTNRKIELTGTPEGLNITEAVNAGQVIIASSNIEVLQVSGQYLMPVAAGTAKVTVSVKITDKEGTENITETDSVEITLLPALKANYNVISVGEIMEVDNVKTFKYIVKGKISGWQYADKTDGTKYGNFYLQDETDPSKEILVYGATATTTALTHDDENDVFGFTNPKDFLTNPVTSALKIGDTIYMEAFRCDYNGKLEINGVICDSIKNIMTYENSKATAYNIVGKITAWKDSNTNATNYGNFMLTDLADPTSSILVYGSTVTTTALTYNADKAVYAFKNPQDFLTNENTMNVTIGDVVALKAIRADYNGALQLTGLYLGSTAH